MKPSRTTSQETARPKVADAGDATPGPSASQPWRGAALDRRRALGVLAASTAFAATAAAVAPTRAAAAPRAVSPETADVYRRAIVIDGSISLILVLDPEWAPGRPPPARWLTEIAGSGITAIVADVSTQGGLEPTRQRLAEFEAALAGYPKLLARVRSQSELAEAKRSGRLGLIYVMQFPEALGERFERLDMFHDLGVRVIQPTNNGRSAFGDGCNEPDNRGLTPVGRDLVAALNERRVLLDLSHAGSQTQAEAIAVTKAPCAIRNTGCRALADFPRNARDEEIRAVADKGGVVGIYFMSFLSSKGPQTSAHVVRHVEYALKVAGEDHVGIGTDNGVPSIVDEAWYRAAAPKYHDETRRGLAAAGETWLNYVPQYNSPRRMELLADDLIRRGHPPRRVEKILGGNFARLFSEVWG